MTRTAILGQITALVRWASRLQWSALRVPVDAQEDDGRMADDVMALDERLARLELTVAAGFKELGDRMGRLEDLTDALNVKLDVSVETLDAKLQLVLERIDAHIREVRVWTEAIVKEHRADRRADVADARRSSRPDPGVGAGSPSVTRSGAQPGALTPNSKQAYRQRVSLKWSAAYCAAQEPGDDSIVLAGRQMPYSTRLRTSGKHRPHRRW